MASILVIIVILALGVLAFFKIPIVQALATIVVALVSSFVAFGYYEILGNLLAGFVEGLAAWAQTISFLLLFILVFAVLQTGVVTLLRGKISLGQLAEQIGRPICGLVLGWIAAGVLLTAMWLAPLGSSLPYSRFDSSRPEPKAPQGVLLNADGMVAGWFQMVSGGSFRAIHKPASFGVVRAGFLDQMSLCGLNEKIARATKESALKAPKKDGVWESPVGLVDAEGQSVASADGQQLMVVRLGISKKALREGPFSLAQVSVVCQSRDGSGPTVTGRGEAVYPIGYLTAPKQMESKSLAAEISIEADKVKDSTQWIDFVVPVPRDMAPALGRFKLNNAVLLSSAVSAEEAPEPSDFGNVVKSKKASAASGAEANET
jgi:hypothetical protein